MEPNENALAEVAQPSSLRVQFAISNSATDHGVPTVDDREWIRKSSPSLGSGPSVQGRSSPRFCSANARGSEPSFRNSEHDSMGTDGFSRWKAERTDICGNFENRERVLQVHAEPWKADFSVGPELPELPESYGYHQDGGKSSRPSDALHSHEVGKCGIISGRDGRDEEKPRYGGRGVRDDGTGWSGEDGERKCLDDPDCSAATRARQVEEQVMPSEGLSGVSPASVDDKSISTSRTDTVMHVDQCLRQLERLSTCLQEEADALLALSKEVHDVKSPSNNAKYGQFDIDLLDIL